MSDAKPCATCGTPTVREVPPDMAEKWRKKLLELPVCCDACTAAAEEEERRQAAHAEALGRERHVNARRAAAGIPPRWRDIGWGEPSPSHAGALAAAQRWARSELNGLVLTGPVGVGKSHLAAAAAWFRLLSEPVRWLSTPVLFAHLALRFENPLHEAALNVLAGTTALVIDDLDKARPTDYAAEQLLTGVESRYQADAPLLVTTNLSLEEIAARYPVAGEAIASRLVEHCEPYVLDGADRRLEIGRAA